MVIYRGCQFSEGLYWGVEEGVWLRPEPEGWVTGMADPSQTLAGRLLQVSFRAVGRRLERRKTAATIESAKWVGPFPIGLTGILLEVNERLLTDPNLVNRDPYGEGWFLRLQPLRFAEEIDLLVAGERVREAWRERLDRDGIQCYRCAEGEGT